MMRKYVAALAFVAAVAVSGLSTQASAFGEGMFVDVYGGATLPGTSTYNGSDYDMLLGGAFGASAGVNAPIPGIAFKLDTMASGGEYDGYSYGVYNFSVMAVGEFSADLNEMFAVYGALGVGAVHVQYYSSDYAGWGAGYQAAVGARAAVADNVSVFGELKYVNTFGEVDTNGYDIQYPTLNALVGLRFSFD